MIYGDERLPDRFWAKVYPEPNTGCWLWSGAMTLNGYGQTVADVPRKLQLAHRWTYAVEHGEWSPVGKDTDHLCRQPSCVNPDHLEVVTRQVNCLRGERGNRRTHCPRGHAMDDANTYTSWSKNKLDERVQRRDCHTCKKNRDRLHAQAHQAGYMLTNRAAELRASTP